MRVLIRQWRTDRSQPPETRSVEAETLKIGRGTDQHLQLADIRVALAHAEVRRSGRAFHLRTRGSHEVWCNGVPVRECLLAVGDALDCGRFRLQLAPPESGAELVLEVAERLDARSERAQRGAGLRLGDSLSMRGIAWPLAILVLAAFLAAPLLLRYGVAQTPRAALPALTDVAWTPGAGSRAHGFFAQDCARCHGAPFERVRNEACTDCHTQTAHHTDSTALAAHPALSALRCADCHHEHTGPQGLIAEHPAVCVDCHAEPETRFGDAQLAGSANFGSAHPPFTPRLAQRDPASGVVRRVERRQGATALHEDTGLLFPHDLHLAKGGIGSPQGQQQLDCADCHVPDRAGLSFAPVEMEAHCASCHRLDFDPDTPERTVPHAQPAQVAAELRDYYARRALEGGIDDAAAPAVLRERRRPGSTLPAPAARAALEWAEARSAQTLRDVFDRRVCGECHVVLRTDDPALPWDVAPVDAREHALDSARFAHGAHRSEDCTSCHAADSSAQSSDVLLPTVERCRDCHGSVDAPDKVASSCVMCHGFHRADTLQLAAPAPPETPR